MDPVYTTEIADVLVVEDVSADMARQLSKPGCKHLADIIYQELICASGPGSPNGIEMRPFGRGGGLECFVESMLQLGDTEVTVVLKRHKGWILVLAVQTAPITPVIEAVVEMLAIDRLRRARKALENDVQVRLQRLVQPAVDCKR